MTIIQKLLDAGIPVIVEESNDDLGQYTYANGMTEEQYRQVALILNPPAPERAINTDANLAVEEATAEMLKPKEKRDSDFALRSLLHYVKIKVKKQ